MRKLALSDEILLQIEKPARYIGNEVNMVVKDPSRVPVRYAMCAKCADFHILTSSVILTFRFYYYFSKKQAF